MAGRVTGDNFSDDEFDNISIDAFEELENNAIQFTQAQRTAGAGPTVPPSSDYGDDIEDDDLDDAIVIDESRSTPAINTNFKAVKTSNPNQQDQKPSASANALANRPRSSIPLPPKFHDVPGPRLPIPVPQYESMLAEQGSQPQSVPDARVESLQKQIEELIRERNGLKSDLNSKAGEIAIVRSKQEKAAKEYERELITVRKINEDKAAKLQKDLEAARISEKRAATERDFLKLDVAEASRSRKVTEKIVEKTGIANIGTPKKKKLFAHRDGFDDDEIEVISPSKNSPSNARRTTSSPSRGKRKRKPVESPAGPLEVISVDEPKHVDQHGMLDESILKRLAIQDDRYDFLGTILDHRKDSKHLRTIEELGKYKFPSNPIESCEAMILGKLPTLGHRKPTTDLPIEFCNLIISLWTRCLSEIYLDPIYLFVDLLILAVELKTTAIAPHIIDTLVKLIQETVDKVIIARFQRTPLPSPYREHIDTTACFSLLYLTALGCMCEHQHIVRFWKLMRYDMTIMLFHPEQLTADTELMISLLSTSVFKDSFGCSVGDEAQDLIIYAEIINHLTRLLDEVPDKPQNGGKMESDVMFRLRLQILQLMTGMTRSPFASRCIVTHRFAIGRLVKLISDELDILYDYRPSKKESSRIISLATRLLYHLVTKYDDIIDMQQKLSVLPGGNQKYLLCLSRLNFSEDDLILESDIDPDVATYALEMLELVVTPEEGDAIHSAFSSQ